MIGVSGRGDFCQERKGTYKLVINRVREKIGLPHSLTNSLSHLQLHLSSRQPIFIFLRQNDLKNLDFYSCIIIDVNRK